MSEEVEETPREAYSEDDTRISCAWIQRRCRLPSFFHLYKAIGRTHIPASKSLQSRNTQSFCAQCHFSIIIKVLQCHEGGGAPLCPGYPPPGPP
jgi:hypothetical protein